MKENNKTKPTKTISVFIIVLIILAIAIIAMLVYNIITRNNQSADGKIVYDTTTGQVVDEALVELYYMEETERIKYYFNLYIECLENGEYEKAYNMLDAKFKNNYFKTLDSYITYVSNKYSPIISVTYDDITRMGNYYVLDITFLDLFSATGEDIAGETQKFIIYETNYNEYTMSFQAE